MKLRLLWTENTLEVKKFTLPITSHHVLNQPFLAPSPVTHAYLISHQTACFPVNVQGQGHRVTVIKIYKVAQ